VVRRLDVRLDPLGRQRSRQMLTACVPRNRPG
jgi:hypothetical protein